MNFEQIERLNFICEALHESTKNKTQIRDYVESKTKKPFAYRTLKADIERLRNDLKVEIEYIKYSAHTGFYKIPSGINFGDQFILYSMDFVSFSKDINKLIFAA